LTKLEVGMGGFDVSHKDSILIYLAIVLCD